MTVTLSRNNSEPNRYKKSLTQLATVNAKLLSQQTDIVRPSLQLSGNALVGANYAYIPDFNRKYFITAITQLAAGMYQVDLKCDVLSSAYDLGLNGCSGLVERNERDYNGYLEDDMIRTYQNGQVVLKSFPSGFSAGMQNILVMAGGDLS